ncbi:hypothetical protein ASZ90_016801 [hydrocarbon metagenome]|uniref:Uncharacterized protein n=1 Tax=hydrocarbon metagenome TaxID=938273 RepID=A0A0W8EBA1_9ZZZZ
MDDEKIRAAFEKEGITTDIKCPEAFAIAEKYGVSKTEVARYCNTHGVKIRACQLGCFK